MRGFQWGYWGTPGGNWTWPPNRGNLFYLAYAPWPQGTCASFAELDQQLLTNEDLAENVYATIYADARIPKRDKDRLRVQAENQQIILKGTVKNRHSKMWAYLDAFQTPGVADVANRITIAQPSSLENFE